MTREEYEALDVVGQLKFWASIDKGANLPDFLGGFDWWAASHCLIMDAIVEIEFLRKRAGVVSDGEDVKAIKDRVHPGRGRSALDTP